MSWFKRIIFSILHVINRATKWFKLPSKRWTVPVAVRVLFLRLKSSLSSFHVYHFYLSSWSHINPRQIDCCIARNCKIIIPQVLQSQSLFWPISLLSMKAYRLRFLQAVQQTCKSTPKTVTKAKLLKPGVNGWRKICVYKMSCLLPRVKMYCKT